MQPFEELLEILQNHIYQLVGSKFHQKMLENNEVML